MIHESLIPNQEICCVWNLSIEFEKKNFFLFWIISFSIEPSFWSERSNIPLFLLILTYCIPDGIGIRGEEKHSTTPRGAVKKKRKLLLEFTFFFFPFLNSKQSRFEDESL
jgi:hypothetical protein